MEEAENYVARHEASFVQAGDKFYLFGGRESARRLDTYDYASNTWFRSATAPVEFNHFQAVEYQGLIWVIGAFRNNRFPAERPAESIYVFDPAHNVWMEGPEIPEERRRGSTGLVVHDDKFYVAAGNTDGHNGGFVSWFDEYDPQTGAWTTLADAPRPRDHFHAEVANGKLYAIGGRLSGGRGGVFAPLIAEVDVYDFTTNAWTTLPPEANLPTPRAAASVATFDGKIMVIGGEGNGRAYDTVEALDPLTNSWESLAPLNYRRHGTQAIASGDGIYITAGSPNQGGGNQRNMEVFNVDRPSGTASVAGVLSVPMETSVVAGTSEPILLSHVDGNEGIFITDLSLSGENSSEFVLDYLADAPFLLPIGSTHELFVEYTGMSNDVSARLDITYSGSQSATIALTGRIVPEPAADAFSFAVCCLGMMHRSRRRRLANRLSC